MPVAQDYWNKSRETQTTEFTIYPIGTHTRVSVDSIQTLTAPTGASILIFQSEGGTIRYTLDNGSTNPTTTLGFRLGTSDGERRIDLFPKASIKIVGEAAGYFVNYQWFAASQKHL